MVGLDIETSEDERKIVKISSFRKKAISASNRFKNSFRRKSRGRIKSEPGGINAEDLRSIDTFRQLLLKDDLLPTKHDDPYMMLRFFFSSSDQTKVMYCVMKADIKRWCVNSTHERKKFATQVQLKIDDWHFGK